MRDRAALVEHEPRRTPRSTEHSTASGAAVPQTSSSQPKDSQTSWAGVCPASSRRSTASQIAGERSPCRRASRGPRSRRSWISPPKGGCSTGPRRRPARRRGAPSARPGARRSPRPSPAYHGARTGDGPRATVQTDLYALGLNPTNFRKSSGIGHGFPIGKSPGITAEGNEGAAGAATPRRSK